MGIPFFVRLLVIAVFGAFLGGQINRGIYRLAYHPRRIGPWSPAPKGAPRRRWFDRIPIVGWITLRRESPPQPSGFWIRPLFIEVFAAAGLAALYWWETQGGLLPANGGPAVNSLLGQQIIHAQFLAHVVLLALMTVATFIDFDEKMIPDTITVPGVIVGLLIAALLPASKMVSTIIASPVGKTTWSPLLLETPAVSLAQHARQQKQSNASETQTPRHEHGSPINFIPRVFNPWPDWLNQFRGLLLGLACFLAWCAAITPYTWTTRRGWRKAFVYFFESIRRSGYAWLIGAIAVIGSAGIIAVWRWGQADAAPLATPWQSLLSSLVGMAFGAGLVWAVRIIATFALQKEAMGFGDVTLMAMIGVYLGWQASLLVFFLAPFAALFIALTQWLLTKEHEIAFGPYLCFSALLVIVFWNAIWNERAYQTFETLGWMIPQLVGVCLLLMGGLLWGWRVFQDIVFGPAPVNGER